MTKPVIRKFTLCRYSSSEEKEPERISVFQEKMIEYHKVWMNRRDLHNYMTGFVEGINFHAKETTYCYDDFREDLGDKNLPVHEI